MRESHSLFATGLACTILCCCCFSGVAFIYIPKPKTGSKRSVALVSRILDFNVNGAVRSSVVTTRYIGDHQHGGVDWWSRLDAQVLIVTRDTTWTSNTKLHRRMIISKLEPPLITIYVYIGLLIMNKLPFSLSVMDEDDDVTRQSSFMFELICLSLEWITSVNTCYKTVGNCDSPRPRGQSSIILICWHYNLFSIGLLYWGFVGIQGQTRHVVRTGNEHNP